MQSKATAFHRLEDLNNVQSVLSKTHNNLKWPKTTWNDLEQETNDMKQPTVSQKRPKTIYSKQGTTWNDLHRTNSNFMEPLCLKNNQLEGSNITKKQ